MSKQGSREEEVEAAKKRCRVLIQKIEDLGETTITQACKRTLSKLAHSSLSFLSRLPSALSSQPLSVNIGHLEAIVYILQQPFITAVSRVCKPLPFSSTTKTHSSSDHVHVLIVFTLTKNPVWIIVSDRNPSYISWYPSKKTKGFKSRIEKVLDAARLTNKLRTSSVVRFFSNGVTGFIHQKLKDEFGASKLALKFSDFDFDLSVETEGEWIRVIPGSYKEASVLEIKVDHVVGDVMSCQYGTTDMFVNVLPADCEGGNVNLNLGLGNSFSALLSQMKTVGSTKVEDLPSHDDFINFDTTALIALVSGISNGYAEELLNRPEVELRSLFKGKL